MPGIDSVGGKDLVGSRWKDGYLMRAMKMQQ
jgi:hypothetical protein